MSTTSPSRTLPDDGLAGTLVARVWRPGVGPSVVTLRPEGVIDLSATWPTMSTLLDVPDAAGRVRAAGGERLCSVEALLAHSDIGTRDEALPHLIAPCDLQVIKAAGVTFAASLLERVIEEQARGDPARAEAVRAEVQARVGADLSAVKPGSAEAAALKSTLQARGLWSQYLEVGLGPDAEVFTKAPVLAAVGTGDDVGIRADSSWNNPEPEVVLAVTSRGEIVGASLGNDVNLRDIEGRSALLLGQAKDNNASCAIGPFIRLFDAGFGLDDLRRAELTLRVDGADGFRLDGASAMARISRDPLALVAQATAMHQYPDGFMLFCGTLFAPVADRDAPGQGFTHHVDDIVSIRSASLGELRNRVRHCHQAPPWHFGLRALIGNLAGRGLLSTAL